MHAVAAQALEWVKVSEERVAAAEGAADTGARRAQRARDEDAARDERRRRASRSKRRKRRRPPPSRSSPPPRPGAIGPRSLSRTCARTSQAERERTLAKASEAIGRRRLQDRGGGVAGAARNRDRPGRRRARDRGGESQRADRDRPPGRGGAPADPGRRRQARSPKSSSAPPKRRPPPRPRHDTAIKLETEIEKRVMEGTEEVRREAEESVAQAGRAGRARGRGRRPRPRRGAAAGRVGADQAAGAAPRGARPRRHRGRDSLERQPRPARGPGGRRGRRPDLAAEPAETAALGRLPHLLALAAPAGARECAGPDNLARMREVRIRDTLSGAVQSIDPDARGRHLRLRPDRLQPHPHRQRAPVRRLLAVRALPALGGLQGAARRQRHRHQRQDLHRGGAGGGGLGEVRRGDDRRLHRATPTRSGSAGPTPSRRRPRRSRGSSS